MLIDERKFFDESGKARPEVMEARKQVRMKSAAAGYYGMFAPESVGGGELGVRRWCSWRRRFTGDTAPVARSSRGRRAFSASRRWRRSWMAPRTCWWPSATRAQGLSCRDLQRREDGLLRIERGQRRLRRLGHQDQRQKRRRRLGDQRKQTVDHELAVCRLRDRFRRHRRGYGEERKGGISAFFVEMSGPGYTFDGVLPVMGHRAATAARCRSITCGSGRPAGRREDQGFQIAMFGISEGRSRSARTASACASTRSTAPWNTAQNG